MEDDMVSGIYSYNAYPSPPPRVLSIMSLGLDSRRRERNHYIDARIDQRIRQFESLPSIMTYRAPRTRLRASILVLPMHGSLLRLGRTDSDGRERHPDGGTPAVPTALHLIDLVGYNNDFDAKRRKKGIELPTGLKEQLKRS
ncbi:uncharacterized protein TRAVEDRAFT_49400 [Trametes versicolor FP-101664 SS1]|uniref:uncharacterized protein n=1 Tax=Trametes versicolor (strain FP-101664) TaxID=717944 RepID=UPI0004621B60|nr:uncharacterized protein TRAVEDRAFT_49400 [Trametes versicolor FP-101664 SS1]EIW56580.1 hypothetical protein TRAVEDRAFT_49400 [Trametes versicolor FP-101664 SS1]